MRKEHEEVARQLRDFPRGATSWWLQCQLKWSRERTRKVLRSMQYNGLVRCEEQRYWIYTGPVFE